MADTETIETTEIAPWDPDKPAMAHIARWRIYGQSDENDRTALCGARLIGIPAPPGYEPTCETCRFLIASYLMKGEELWRENQT